jgi:hypothetical protein
MGVYNLKQEGVETVAEFIFRGGEITYPKPKGNSNYCKYCGTWNSIKRYYNSEYSTRTHYNREWGCFEEWIIQTKVLQYSRCQCCHRIIKEYNIKEDKNDG